MTDDATATDGRTDVRHAFTAMPPLQFFTLSPLLSEVFFEVENEKGRRGGVSERARQRARQRFRETWDGRRVRPPLGTDSKLRVKVSEAFPPFSRWSACSVLIPSSRRKCKIRQRWWGTPFARKLRCVGISSSKNICSRSRPWGPFFSREVDFFLDFYFIPISMAILS